MASFKDMFSRSVDVNSGAAMNQYHTPHGTLGVTDNNDGTYTVHSVTNGTVQNNVDKATLQAILNGSITFGEQLTDAERKELNNLKEEKEKWIRQQRLKGFQKLPAHLRQEIVDEAYLKDCINNMNNIDETEFDSNDRISELEQKESNASLATWMGQAHAHTINLQGASNWYILHTDGTSYQPIDQMIFKYRKIINEFSTEELAEAHAAATLEESL